MIDPDAYIGRRAWFRCCREWQYMLGSSPPEVLLQCPDCGSLRWKDTGVGNPRPDRLEWSRG